MRYAEINRKFTELVADYFAQGWRINTKTMSGTQGEVAKVDLTDGNHITRIMLLREHKNYHDGYKLVVGVFNNDVAIPNAHDGWRTLWNSELTTLEEYEWFEAGYSKNWFVSEETMKANKAKRTERFYTKFVNDEVDITAKAARIVLPYVRRQKGCKTAKLSDVRVVKGTNHGKKYFLVICKGHRFILK